MITINLGPQLARAALALAAGLPWLAACGGLLLGVGLVLGAWLRRAERIRRDGVELHFANTLSRTGLWAGVQLLAVRSTRLSSLLDQLSVSAERPEELVHVLQSERATLLGPTRLTVLDDTYATDWVQRTLGELGRQPVPAEALPAPRRLLAVVFAGGERPRELSSLPALARHLEGCSAVGLVACPVLPVAQGAGAARWASQGLLLIGMLALVLLGLGALGSIGILTRLRSAPVCPQPVAPPPPEGGACTSPGGGNIPSGSAMTATEPAQGQRSLPESLGSKKKDPAETKETREARDTKDPPRDPKDPRDLKERKTDDKPAGEKTAGADRGSGVKPGGKLAADNKSARAAGVGEGTGAHATGEATFGPPVSGHRGDMRSAGGR